MRIPFIFAGLIATSSIGAPAGAVTTFANYSQVGAGTSIAYNAVSGVGTVGAIDQNGVSPVRVSFNFADAFLMAAGLTNLAADFRMNLTATQAPLASMPNFVVQQGLVGGFSFTYAGATPLTVNGHTYATGANLLTGTFADATIFGLASATTGALSGSGTNGGIVFTSDFLTFGTGTNDATFGLNAITPPLASGSTALNSFVAASVGTFGSAVAPQVAALPEPQTWATMLVGFGLVGRSMRRRRRFAPAHA